jgi:hypothetical protein
MLKIQDNGDNYTVQMDHVVVLGKQDPFFNFRQYVEDLIKHFDHDMTKTLHQVVLKDS